MGGLWKHVDNCLSSLVFFVLVVETFRGDFAQFELLVAREQPQTRAQLHAEDGAYFGTPPGVI
jgi:hypothetical protein